VTTQILTLQRKSTVQPNSISYSLLDEQ